LHRLVRSRFIVGAASIVAARAPVAASSGAPKRRADIRIGWSGASCEAATYVAYLNGFFAREGLDVELIRLGDPLAAPAAIRSGAVDAVSSLLYLWLKPIEDGLDARLTAGLHGGCVRLVAAAGSPIRELGQVKRSDDRDRWNRRTRDEFLCLALAQACNRSGAGRSMAVVPAGGICRCARTRRSARRRGPRSRRLRSHAQ
jgi:ABC-type nitrate/sulfonate/bicarbonate transport system substrate-binding protein